MSESDRILYPRAALKQWLGHGASQYSYNLDEFLKLIEPTYQAYEEYIRRCVAGLTTVAAQRAALHQEEDITKLREIILKLVPFWGLDGGAYADKETSIQLERQYRESFLDSNSHCLGAACFDGIKYCLDPVERVVGILRYRLIFLP